MGKKDFSHFFLRCCWLNGSREKMIMWWLSTENSLFNLSLIQFVSSSAEIQQNSLRIVKTSSSSTSLICMKFELNFKIKNVSLNVAAFCVVEAAPEQSLFCIYHPPVCYFFTLAKTCSVPKKDVCEMFHASCRWNANHLDIYLKFNRNVRWLKMLARTVSNYDAKSNCWRIHQPTLSESESSRKTFIIILWLTWIHGWLSKKRRMSRKMIFWMDWFFRSSSIYFAVMTLELVSKVKTWINLYINFIKLPTQIDAVWRVSSCHVKYDTCWNGMCCKHHRRIRLDEIFV